MGVISFEVEGLGPFRVQGRGCDVEFPRVRRRLCRGSKFRVESTFTGFGLHDEKPKYIEVNDRVETLTIIDHPNCRPLIDSHPFWNGLRIFGSRL